ncbi:hypothetical protein SKAU_G00010760 [Synaphobranchus kaupii]|uniref:Uncharacterized protein n=1 Tax=Synaphobranchus kaupii TaxID=118154 RepID=A0A9Q1GB36_SYNKA|nr:hypothetical protein SKAU_G00010760 [Synaphobranchus kaupii]
MRLHQSKAPRKEAIGTLIANPPPQVHTHAHTHTPLCLEEGPVMFGQLRGDSSPEGRRHRTELRSHSGLAPRVPTWSGARLPLCELDQST